MNFQRNFKEEIITDLLHSKHTFVLLPSLMMLQKPGIGEPVYKSIGAAVRCVITVCEGINDERGCFGPHHIPAGNKPKMAADGNISSHILLSHKKFTKSSHYTTYLLIWRNI